MKYDDVGRAVSFNHGQENLVGIICGAEIDETKHVFRYTVAVLNHENVVVESSRCYVWYGPIPANGRTQ
jgi:hypothetical protein